jgi:hypothetical protein
MSAGIDKCVFSLYNPVACEVVMRFLMILVLGGATCGDSTKDSGETTVETETGECPTIYEFDQDCDGYVHEGDDPCTCAACAPGGEVPEDAGDTYVSTSMMCGGHYCCYSTVGGDCDDADPEVYPGHGSCIEISESM